MKTNKKFVFGMLMLLGILLFSAMPFAAAERYVQYNFNERTFLANGTVVDSATPVNGVSSVGYVCLDAACSQLGAQIAGLTGSSGAGNSMVLTFPTTLQNPNGYGIYFYKDGYISWEQIANWWGTMPGETISTPDTTTTPRYLAKKEGCSADILGIAVLNEVEANQPLMININASLGASVSSAFNSNGPIAAPIPGLENQSSIATRISVDVRNAGGNSVFSNSTIKNITFNGNTSEVFTWTPASKGDYRVIISTNPVDAKCLSPVPDSEEARVVVLAEQPRNMCYTLLQDLETTPQEGSINADNNIAITVYKLSNAADNSNSLTALASTMSLSIVSQRTGQTIYQMTSNAPANSNINDYEAFSWPWLAAEGDYTLSVSGIASLCPYQRNTAETITKTIHVNGTRVNHAPEITSEPDTYADADARYKYKVEASDPDNDVLSYSLTEKPSGMKIDSETGLLEWIPSNAKVGKKYNVTIVVSDGSLTATQTFQIEVTRKEIETPLEVSEEPSSNVAVVQYPAVQEAKPSGEIGMPLVTMVLLNIAGIAFIIWILNLLFSVFKI